MSNPTSIYSEQRCGANFHLLPGRLRISVPQLLNNQDLANTVAHQLARFPGVKMSYANPVSGQVLLYFDPGRTDLYRLLSLFCKASLPDHDGRPSPGSPAGDKAGRGVPGPAAAASDPLRTKAVPWHSMDVKKALALFGTDDQSGLSWQTARTRLAVFGANEFVPAAKISFWQIVFGSLKGFMTQLLIVAAGVSLAVGETVDAAVITAIVVLQALIEAVQGCRAEQSLTSLKRLSVPQATVLRSGALARIPKDQLVPGDILRLTAGDIVPADARVIESSGLSTNEAPLTGESIPVPKNDRQQKEALLPVADQTNMLFSGTGIISGRASALIVATGMRTEMGKIAYLLNDVQKEQTGLQQQLEYLGKRITGLVAGSVGTIAAVNLVRGGAILETLRSGISLAVGAVPEGLPAVVTVALASGMQRMARRKAIVRHMAAVETLGSATVICTDKTGTLTKNEMTVRELYIAPHSYQVAGSGYCPNGEIKAVGAAPSPREFARVGKTLRAAVLCNNAELKPGPDGQWRVIGDPTEAALLAAAGKVGLDHQAVRRSSCRRREIAFDADRRLMVVVCQHAGGQYGVYVKGAPDTVINCCTTILHSPGGRTLDLKKRRELLAVNEAMGSKGLRVIAVAYKTLSAGDDLEKADLQSELTFCGLIGMADPVRPGVAQAIEKCHTAGIKVIMITGDHQRTAEAVAARLGILNRGISITGRQLEQLSDAEFEQQIRDITVFSRTAPEQKLRIVRALKRQGQIVAMTGDGVNDAPAIKEADIGIAMGLGGTEVARDAAGITLKDDNFVTIVSGIEEGRTVGINLSKSVNYILSGSLGQLLAVFCSTVCGLPAPMLPSQILWVNLVTESLPAMALTADPPAPGYMNQAPRPGNRFLQDNGQTIIRKGVLAGLISFGLYSVGLMWGGWPLRKARTMAFSQLVVNRVVNLVNERRLAGMSGLFGNSNPLILPAAALSICALGATMYLPFMQPLFSTVPIGLGDWCILAVNSLAAAKVDSLRRIT